MTLKTFREAYLAAGFLAHHQRGCSRCERHNVWGEPPCPLAQAAHDAVDKADRMLGIDLQSPTGRKDAWLQRSRFLK